MLLAQGQRFRLPSQYIGPGSHSWLRAPALVYSEVSCLCTFLGLEACPLLPLVGIFDSLPSDGQDGFGLIITTPFLDISCSYVNSHFVFALICTGL